MFKVKSFINAAAFPSFIMLVVFLALRGKPILVGDALEYIVQTQSIVFDGTLSVDLAARAEYWNKANPFGSSLKKVRKNTKELIESAQAGGGFGSLYPDRFGSYRYIHFWGYSLLVSPIYLLLHKFTPSAEYWSFKVVNLFLLLIPFFIFYIRQRSFSTVFSFVIILVSPIISYIDWPHCEILLWSLVLTSFGLADTKFRRLSPLLLGVASSQNIPLALFFPLLAFLSLQWWQHDWWQALFYNVLGVLLASASLVYFQYYFGTPSLYDDLGFANFSYASAGRVYTLLFGPLVGAVWFFPAIFAFLPSYLNRKNILLFLLVIVSVVATTWLASSTSNLRSAQIGATRYSVWLMAPFHFLLISYSSLISTRKKASILGATLFLLVVLGWGVWRFPIKNVNNLFYQAPAAKYIYKVFPIIEDIEVISEIILQREIPSSDYFTDLYIWNLGKNSSLWIVPSKVINGSGRIWWLTNGIPPNYSSPVSKPFRVKGPAVTLNRKGIPGYNYHPVLGSYLTIWVDRSVDPRSVSGSIHTYIK